VTSQHALHRGVALVGAGRQRSVESSNVHAHVGTRASLPLPAVAMQARSDIEL